MYGLKQVLIFVFCFHLFGCDYSNSKETNENLMVSEIIDQVPSGFPVNFALLTHEDEIYVSYYNQDHNMVIAKKEISASNWDKKILDTKIGHDSHNYIAITIDDEGYLHIVGNIHSSPLVYFISEQPYDIHSIKPLHHMTGAEEDVTTYPEFMRGPEDELIFHYRYGISGNGYEVYNIWKPEKQKWERLFDTPLTDGQGKMNAYLQGPKLGSDGYFHLLWVWRDTPDCATNHDLSYARSKDLIHWESVDNEKLELPITIEDESTYVDSTPIYGGLINIGIKIGFDANDNFLAGYHKYDEDGNTQLYIAEYQTGKWLHHKITDWDYRWDFKGYGTIVNELLLEPIYPDREGNLVFGYHHFQKGNNQLIIDPGTFKIIREEPLWVNYPMEIDSVQSKIPNMLVHKVFDSGNDKSNNYLLRWETLPPNNDQKRQDTFPPSNLELLKY